MGGLPVAFTSEFYDDLNKKRQWTAFCAKNKSYVEKTEFKAVMEAIRNFLALPVRAVQTSLKTCVLPKWGEHKLSDMRTVEVEGWLHSLPLANATKA